MNSTALVEPASGEPYPKAPAESVRHCILCAVGAHGELHPIRPNSGEDDPGEYPEGPPTPPADGDDGEPEIGGAAARQDEPEEHPAEEARAARPSRDPGAPTQADRDAHAATHLPFRSWCDACVQGRRDAPPHCRQKRVAGEVPEVAFDYAYIRRDDEEEVATLLVMRDRYSKALRSLAVSFTHLPRSTSSSPSLSKLPTPPKYTPP